MFSIKENLSSLESEGVFMKFFAKCIILFVALAIIFTIAAELLFENVNPLPINILLSAVLSLLITILYGWIDGVYIHPTAG